MYLNNLWKKKRKKTLTISSNFKKKIDPNFLPKKEKKNHFLLTEIKKMFSKHLKIFEKHLTPDQKFKNQEFKGKKFTRKFIEQQATKAFIKKDEKPTGKSKLKLKTPIDKRGF